MYIDAEDVFMYGYGYFVTVERRVGDLKNLHEDNFLGKIVADKRRRVGRIIG